MQYAVQLAEQSAPFAIFVRLDLWWCVLVSLAPLRIVLCVCEKEVGCLCLCLCVCACSSYVCGCVTLQVGIVVCVRVFLVMRKPQ